MHARETLASGRIREREFFQITPEKAYTVFRKVAKLQGDSRSLELVGATAEGQEEEQIIKRRPHFSFKCWIFLLARACPTFTTTLRSAPLQILRIT
ncbi:MAG: hypothetical protein FWF45_07085 [Coriobacteriia bacterium]|nr:hypothetical protein [Coriobacteriia bacterium]